ncbi:TonB-dependent receptor [Chromatiaceae bacterium AAb-1]|nr:TonB-dependent receptor [Chromatiaceae bacterium AAb-1]
MKSLQSTGFRLSTLTLFILAGFSHQAVAQSAAVTAEEEGVERIVVTTQKRVQSIQDVPVTVTAFTGEFLERLGISDLDVLSDITPGLVIQEQSPNNPGFVIRGITSDSGSAQSAPRVSVYYNGVDISRSRGSYFEMFDIERVEVVKGPQATLFGTAASVGALSVTTARPQQDFSAEIKLGTGSESAKNVGGFVTGGSELIQGRLAFTWREQDGYVRNIAEGQNDLNGVDRVAFRPSLRITPSDDLTIDLVYTNEKNKDPGTAFTSGLYAPTGGDTSPYSFVELAGSPFSAEVLGSDKIGLDRTVEDINLTVDWTLSERFSFTSITAHRSFESLEIFDADGTQAWFLEFAEDAKGDQFSQEFRLAYHTDKVAAFFGVSYFEEDGYQRVPFSTEESIFLNCTGLLRQMMGIDVPCILPDGSVPQLTPVLTGGALQMLPYASEYTNYGDNKAFSVFADMSYQLNDKWELTAGIRFIDEDRTSAYSSVMPNSVLAGLAGAAQPLLPFVSTAGEKVSAKGSFDAWLPRFNALYRLNNNTNFYATVSKGRRSDVLEVTSGYNVDNQVVASVTEVPAETIWNYEFGVKGQTAGNRIRYAVSAYYQDYENFQVTRQDEGGNPYTDNAGSAANAGVEAELKAALNDGLDLFANLAYIDAKIDKDSNNGELAGNRFRLQPEWTAAVGLLYSTELGGAYRFNSSLVYSFRSEVFFEEDNAPVAGLDIRQGAVQLTSARVGIENTAQKWTLTLYASNLFDKEYLVDAGNTGAAFGHPTFIIGQPRFIGLEFSKRFGF